MASALSHAIASAALGKVYSGAKQPLKFWLLAAFCAVVPDADVIGFKFGIAYESLFGHRGFTHSIVFALLLALAGNFAQTDPLFPRETDPSIPEQTDPSFSE